MDGQTIYKTEFLTRYGIPRQITIKRIIPPNSIDLATGSEDALRDSFSDVAEIHYEILSSRIRYNGIEMPTSQFFRTSSFTIHWHRAFTGLDGKEYEWELGLSGCKLYLKDDPRPLVASYHTRNLGIIGEARPSSFEVYPGGQHMVDLIFVTFLFVERVRILRLRKSAG